MTRYMADACSSAALPGWKLQASYVDGLCAVNRHDLVRISSIASNAGNAGDVEPGNPNWWTWVSWVVRRRLSGEDPYLYCCADGYGDDAVWSGWRHADGANIFHNAGVPEPHWWVFKNSEQIPDYAMMCQFAWNVSPGYDISSARNYLPGIDPKSRDEMPRIYRYPSTGEEWYADGQVYFHMTNPADVTQLANNGIEVIDNMPDDFHADYLAATAKPTTTFSGNLPVVINGTGTLKVG